jgi:hypothetical protein
MALVSFATDIKPLFRTIDINHMKPHGVLLDDYTYMSDSTNDHKNAQDVLTALSPQDGASPDMPPGGPYWTPGQLALLTKWMTDGYQP